MSTVSYTAADATGNQTNILYSWALTTANTDGAPVPTLQASDLTFQAVGTWGGATLTLQGSNDGTNWFSLTGAGGTTAATMTGDGGKKTNEAPVYVRPNLTTAGTGATVAVTLLARMHQMLRV